MASLIKGVEEQGWRARSERRISQGRCVSVDTLLHSCVLDVGEYDATGAPVLLRDVPFSPQTPPSVGDLVPLSYFNSSPHSIRVAAGQLSGQNGQGTVTTNGGVNSVAAGAGAKIKGDVVLAAGTNITLAEAGQTITIAATGSASGVSSLNGETGAITLSAGSNVTLATPDSSHIVISATGSAGGVTSVNGESGDITLSAGSNVTLTMPDSNHIVISAAGGGGVTSFNTLVGAVNLIAGTNVTLSTSGNNITIDATGTGGAGVMVWNRYTKSYTDFNSGIAATGVPVLLATLSAKTCIHTVVLKHGAQWVGGGIGSTTAQVEDGAGMTWCPVSNIYQSPGDSVIFETAGASVPSYASTSSLRLRVGVTGGTLSDLSAGTLEIWVLISILP